MMRFNEKRQQSLTGTGLSPWFRLKNVEMKGE